MKPVEAIIRSMSAASKTGGPTRSSSFWRTRSSVSLGTGSRTEKRSVTCARVSVASAAPSCTKMPGSPLLRLFRRKVRALPLGIDLAIAVFSAMDIVLAAVPDGSAEALATTLRLGRATLGDFDALPMPAFKSDLSEPWNILITGVGGVIYLFFLAPKLIYDTAPVLHKEDLVYEFVELKQRSYK